MYYTSSWMRQVSWANNSELTPHIQPCSLWKGFRKKYISENKVPQLVVTVCGEGAARSITMAGQRCFGRFIESVSPYQGGGAVRYTASLWVFFETPVGFGDLSPPPPWNKQGIWGFGSCHAVVQESVLCRGRDRGGRGMSGPRWFCLGPGCSGRLNGAPLSFPFFVYYIITNKQKDSSLCVELCRGKGVGLGALSPSFSSSRKAGL